MNTVSIRDMVPDKIKNCITFFVGYCNSVKSKIIQYISKDPLIRGILIIGSGTAAAQVLGIIFVPDYNQDLSSGNLWNVGCFYIISNNIGRCKRIEI